jgi:ferritin-like metal-binding protein YciE
MEKETLRELFESDLEYLYDAERELVDALPLMSDAAATPELRNAFMEHLERSSRQLGRLEEIFGNLDIRPSGRKSRGIGGLIAEGKELVEKGDRLPAGVVDVSLIAAVRRVGHYEIAATRNPPSSWTKPSKRKKRRTRNLSAWQSRGPTPAPRQSAGAERAVPGGR